MNHAISLSVAALLTLAGPAFGNPEETRPATADSAIDCASLGYKPLELEVNDRASHWRAAVAINGKPCKLTLDTGADHIILESWVPKYCGLATRPSEIVAQSVGGMKKLVITEGPLEIGGTVIANQHLRARASGDAAPAAKIRNPLAGVLGLNALRGLGVVLDVRRHTLWIPADPATRIEPLMKARGIAAIPLQRTKRTGHLALTVTTGGRPLRMVLDSGAERTVLSRKAAEAMKLELEASGAIIAGANAANSIPQQAVLTDVAIGKTRLPRLAVHVLPLEEVFKALSDGEDPPIKGILGADLIYQQGGIIDVAADVLYLTGAEPPATDDAVTGHIAIPLQLDDKAHFTIEGKVNGHVARFAVDSGADTILLQLFGTDHTVGIIPGSAFHAGDFQPDGGIGGGGFRFESV